MLDSTDRHPLVPVASRVREVELGLSPPLARSSAYARAAAAPKNESRIPPSAAAEAASAPQIHILADRKGRPLHLRVPGGQRLDSTQARILAEAWTDRRGLA